MAMNGTDRSRSCFVVVGFLLVRSTSLVIVVEGDALWHSTVDLILAYYDLNISMGLHNVFENLMLPLESSIDTSPMIKVRLVIATSD